MTEKGIERLYQIMEMLTDAEQVATMKEVIFNQEMKIDEKKDMAESVKAYNDAMDEVDRIVRLHKDFVQELVFAENNLRELADADNNEYKYEYYKAICDALRSIVAGKAIFDAGYIIDDTDTYRRWRKVTE